MSALSLSETEGGLSLDKLAQFLDQFLGVTRFADDPGGIYQPSDRLIKHLGLALEPWPQLAEWVSSQKLDALFLHRPWQLQPGQLEPTIGVVAYHLAFDECLTLGFNPHLAKALGMTELEVLGEKAGRPIGMLGAVAPQSFGGYRQHVNQVFGGQDQAIAGVEREIAQVAVVGAMTDKLVRQAAQREADLYITGQFRQPARLAVQETGIGMVIVGHRRSEQWGLQALAEILREHWPGLKVVLPPGP
ncbi:MAG TPA: Nif3-like dinuclear metal center hexameric protein [Candidatus Caenarcaniphilales bacterium]